jgi:hypothetical protein
MNSKSFEGKKINIITKIVTTSDESLIDFFHKVVHTVEHGWGLSEILEKEIDNYQNKCWICDGDIRFCKCNANKNKN